MQINNEKPQLNACYSHRHTQKSQLNLQITPKSLIYTDLNTHAFINT